MVKKSSKYVLLTDVVGSRKIKNRATFEKQLEEALQKVQQQNAEVFEMPIQIWKGLDETAALIKQPWQLDRVVNSIQGAIAPFQMRFVLVKGVLDVVPKSGRVAEADGAVFHTAAAKMLELKKSGLIFTCDTGNTLFDSAWQVQVNLVALLKKDWTARQRLMYDTYCETGRQEDVAEKLHITQQNVSKALKSISATQVQALEHALGVWAKTELEKNVLD